MIFDDILKVSKALSYFFEKFLLKFSQRYFLYLLSIKCATADMPV